MKDTLGLRYLHARRRKLAGGAADFIHRSAWKSYSPKLARTRSAHLLVGALPAALLIGPLLLFRSALRTPLLRCLEYFSPLLPRVAEAR
jgi:hypothetical protein